MFEGLPERQQKVITFVKEYLYENGYPPTVREIGKGIGVPSTSLISYYLKRLEERGLITRESSVSRAIRLTIETEDEETAPLVPPDALPVPFLGYIVASAPIPVEALPGTETIEINRALFGRDAENLFALRVQGNSMIDALIGDGDTIILRHQERVENGEMAAVWLNNDAGETTLKKVYYEGPQVRLQPAKPTMDPIFVPTELVQIQGKVVLVIRNLD
jgi:repressor LexA